MKTMLMWLLAATVVMAAPPLPEGLRNVRWQSLPEDVRSVAISPDQRVWVMLAPPTNVMATVFPKEEVAGEFARPSPRLVNVEPVLFEPGGRVWFRYSRRMLAGFDGTNWVERSVGQGQWFTGACPNHGGAAAAGPNLFVAGQAFFPDRVGVHSFDGTNWNYQATGGETSDQRSMTVIAVEQDGLGVIAFARGRQPSLWRWRAGNWSRILLEVPLGDEPFELADAAPVGRDEDAGVLVFWRRQYRTETSAALVRFGKPSTSGIDEIVKELGNAAFAKREAATRELVRMGSGNRPAIEAALSQTKDPEIQMRLEQVLTELKSSQTPSSSSVTVAGYGLTGARLCFYSETGGLYLGAESITGRDGARGPGLLIVDGRGPARVLRGEEFRLPWKSRHGAADRCLRRQTGVCG